MTVAVSTSVPAPSVIGADAVVVIDGAARVTTVLSLAALHAPMTPALFASPL